MPIDLCSSVNSVSNYAFGSSVLNKILSSSIFVAVAISLLMMLLVMILYPAKKGTPFFLVGKMFVYMLFASWLIVFLHDSVLRYEFKEKEHSDQTHDFMHSMMNKDPVYGNYTQIQPTLHQTTPTTAIESPTQTTAIESPTPTPTPTQLQQVPAKPEPTAVTGGSTTIQSDIIGAGRLGGFHPPTTGGNPYK